MSITGAKLFIMCGIPGCGKSTYAHEVIDGRVISSDALREELLGDPSIMHSNGRIFDEFHRRISEGLANGDSIVADSTALDKRSRTNLVSLARITDAEVHLVLFRNNREAVKRNANRARVVPEHAMIRMLDKYERTIIELIQEQSWYTSITEIKSYAGQSSVRRPEAVDNIRFDVG